MAISKNGINIGTVSGGIVNFGGAVIISPISITKTVSRSGEESSDTTSITNSMQSIENAATNLANSLIGRIGRSR